MRKINNLKTQRVLNRYFFFQQEFDIKNEMLEEMDLDFREALNAFLKSHPEFEKMYNERLRQKQEEAFQQFKQNFKEHTGIELSDSKEIILYDKTNSTFEETQESNDFEESDTEESEPLVDEPESEDKKIYQKLYREIVKVTHPDKIQDAQRNKMYVRASNAYESGNYLILIMLANQLGIECEVVPAIEKRIKTSVSELQKQLELMEKSISWLWYTTESVEMKAHFMLTFINNALM